MPTMTMRESKRERNTDEEEGMATPLVPNNASLKNGSIPASIRTLLRLCGIATLFFVLVLYCVPNHPQEKISIGDVILNSTQISQLLNREMKSDTTRRFRPALFVRFGLRWEPHGKRMNAAWEALAKSVQQKDYNVVIASLWCEDHRKNGDYCYEKERIRAYPTMVLFQNVTQFSKGYYNGNRSSQDMLEYLESHLQELKNPSAGKPDFPSLWSVVIFISFILTVVAVKCETGEPSCHKMIEQFKRARNLLCGW